MVGKPKMQNLLGWEVGVEGGGRLGGIIGYRLVCFGKWFGFGLVLVLFLSCSFSEALFEGIFG